MQRIFLSGLLFVPAICLVACSEPPANPPTGTVEQSPAPAVIAASQPGGPPPTAEQAEPEIAGFNTTITMQQLMRSVIDPNAQNLWKAVSYVATLDGVEETMPVTDADWDALLQSAITLAESGNALLIQERPIAGADYDANRPAFQFSAAEIQARRSNGADNWNVIALGMQDLVLETLEAVQRRDIFALTDKGAAINEACEACHANFWYRPQ